MITCNYFPKKTFATKTELFKELRKNVKSIIDIKKSGIYKSNEKLDLTFGFIPGDAYEKIADDNVIKVGPHMKEGFVYPIINTTRYMDMHDDVHFDGIWDKSVKEQAGKLYYVADHKIQVDTIIAWPSDVSAMVKAIPWSFVGKNYPGNTEALIYEIDKNNIVHDVAKKIISDKRPVQNSVRMMYMNIKMGMDSGAPEDKEYKVYYDSKIDSIANNEVAREKGYFFGVEEAKIIKEGSMVILGSNDATSVRQKYQSSDDTEKIIEPDLSTQNRAASSTRVLTELNNLFKTLQ